MSFDYTTIDLSKVTPAQIGHCEKVFDLNHGKWEPFYQVESERDSLVIYTVRWSRDKGFTCTCYAEKEGFIHCKKGYCKHIVWALATAKEEKEALSSLPTIIIPVVQEVAKKEVVVEPKKEKKFTKAQKQREDRCNKGQAFSMFK